MENKQIIVDVETKKAFSQVESKNPSKLGISYVGLLPAETDGSFRPQSYRGFFEPELSGLWPILERAERLVGFNILGFDLPVLSAYYRGDFSHFLVLDILAEIKKITGHRVSLHSVAQTTLKETKIGSGISAIALWEQRRLKELAEYCRQDVLVTAKIFEYGLKNKHLLFKDKWNEERKIEVDFSLPSVKSEVQMTLGIA